MKAYGGVARELQGSYRGATGELWGEADLDRHWASCKGEAGVHRCAQRGTGSGRVRVRVSVKARARARV